MGLRSITVDSTKNNLVTATLSKMEQNIPKNEVSMDYREKYNIAMIYNKLGDNKKFEEYASDAYTEAYSDRANYTRNSQSKFNPYSILLDICEARGDYKSSLELLKELPQNDPAVKIKTDRINALLNSNRTGK